MFVDSAKYFAPFRWGALADLLIGNLLAKQILNSS